MLRGIDAEAVDAEAVDPAAVDLDHALNDARILGEEIVEPDEVAHLARLRRWNVAVAAVVIVERVVEPGRHLHCLFGFGTVTV